MTVRSQPASAGLSLSARGFEPLATQTRTLRLNLMCMGISVLLVLSPAQLLYDERRIADQRWSRLWTSGIFLTHSIAPAQIGAPPLIFRRLRICHPILPVW